VAEFDIAYDEGISRAGDLLDMAVELEVVEKRGSYYYRDGENLAQGRENAKQFLREHPDVADLIEATVREHMTLEDTPTPEMDSKDLDENLAPALDVIESDD
ncbi:MAG: DNA recombination/repair protein RecA, partial [Chloroflexota bacterium]|nr:DNA recombination/repair protein RecA [Chloroflexota bacterium]